MYHAELRCLCHLWENCGAQALRRWERLPAIRLEDAPRVADLARAALSAPELYGEPPVRRAAAVRLHEELGSGLGLGLGVRVISKLDPCKNTARSELRGAPCGAVLLHALQVAAYGLGYCACVLLVHCP